MTRRLDTRRQPLELVNEIEAEEKRRWEQQRRACKTCREWADVIHLEFTDGLEEHWHRWPDPDHRCPDCGRAPEVLTIRLAFDGGELPQPATQDERRDYFEDEL